MPLASDEPEATGPIASAGTAITGEADEPLRWAESCCGLSFICEGREPAGDGRVAVAGGWMAAGTGRDEGAVVLSVATREPAGSDEPRVALLGWAGIIIELDGEVWGDCGELGVCREARE